MNLPQTIFNAYVFSLNAMLMIITKEIWKEDFHCPSQILITWNEAFVIREPQCIWNNLPPQDLKSVGSIGQFKQGIKKVIWDIRFPNGNHVKQL